MCGFVSFLKKHVMKFSPPLAEAQLVKRYKRFLADVALFDDASSVMTLHCPNTGAMTGCAEAGFTVAYSLSDNPKRKYPGTWELACNQQGQWIVVNTQRANQVVAEALADARIEALAGYVDHRAEVKYGEQNSRIDFLLDQHVDGRPACYVEVKSVTLQQAAMDGEPCVPGRGLFPDAVTQRGQKHLDELMVCAQEGKRAVLLFCVMHTGITSVAPAQHIDPVYTQKLLQARAAGVEILAYGCDVSLQGVTLTDPLPVDLNV